ncbi:hypothetical protein HGG75_06465 [Ochrobactrum pseudogrignonense]|nr:hypothetical protein [Brucella pseudogrignonensis]
MPFDPAGPSSKGERSGCGLSIISFLFSNGWMVGSKIGLSIEAFDDAIYWDVSRGRFLFVGQQLPAL